MSHGGRDTRSARPTGSSGAKPGTSSFASPSRDAASSFGPYAGISRTGRGDVRSGTGGDNKSQVHQREFRFAFDDVRGMSGAYPARTKRATTAGPSRSTTPQVRRSTIRTDVQHGRTRSPLLPEKVNGFVLETHFSDSRFGTVDTSIAGAQVVRTVGHEQADRAGEPHGADAPGGQERTHPLRDVHSTEQAAFRVRLLTPPFEAINHEPGDTAGKYKRISAAGVEARQRASHQRGPPTRARQDRHVRTTRARHHRPSLERPRHGTSRRHLHAHEQIRRSSRRGIPARSRGRRRRRGQRRIDREHVNVHDAVPPAGRGVQRDAPGTRLEQPELARVAREELFRSHPESSGDGADRVYSNPGQHARRRRAAVINGAGAGRAGEARGQ